MLLYEILRKYKIDKPGLIEDILFWQKDLSQKAFNEGVAAERKTEIKCQNCHRPVIRDNPQ